jgi:predicted nucleic acid-binding protein
VIVVDTSVWIAARHDRDIAAILRDLIDADEAALALPVRLELWAGVAKHDRKRHEAAHSALPQLIPTEETWSPLTEWIARAGDAGETFTITDLLIASLAGKIGGRVWSLDKDFERMERLKIVSLYSPS